MPYKHNGMSAKHLNAALCKIKCNFLKMNIYMFNLAYISDLNEIMAVTEIIISPRPFFAFGKIHRIVLIRKQLLLIQCRVIRCDADYLIYSKH